MKSLVRMKSFSLHALSIVIALLLWIYVLSTAQTEVVLKVNLHYLMPIGFSVVNQYEESLSIKVQGPKALVRTFEQNVDVLKVNLATNFRKNVSVYELDSSSLGFKTPFGVEVLEIKPRKLTVELEKSMTKSIPIELSTVGAIPIDHKIISQKISPEVLQISGPESVIKNIPKIKTAVVDLSQITKSGSKTLQLAQYDKRVKTSHSEVKFEYNVKTTRANMTIKDLPIYFLSSKRLKSTTSRIANLMVLAENAGGAKLAVNEIKIIADVDDTKQGEQEIKLRAKLPESIHLLKIIPEKIKITVDEIEEK